MEYGRLRFPRKKSTTENRHLDLSILRYCACYVSCLRWNLNVARYQSCDCTISDRMKYNCKTSDSSHPINPVKLISPANAKLNETAFSEIHAKSKCLAFTHNFF